MFFHEFRYELKNSLRNKGEIFWVLLFPLLLSTLFSVAFANINAATETYHTIPVAACIKENTTGEIFAEVLDSLSSDDENAFLSVIYTDWENALELLEQNTVRGIFLADEAVTLTCAPTNRNANSTLAIEQSILEAFLQEYQSNAEVVMDCIQNNAEKLPELITFMQEESNYKQELSLTEGNMDNMVQYYYNLIAMACLYTAFAGCFLAIRNLADCSTLAARKAAAPKRTGRSLTAQLCACLLSQYMCIVINLVYMVYIIQVDFCIPFYLLLFTSLIACITGISFGYMVGCLGKQNETIKTGIIISIAMVCSFLSGLMVGNMRILVEQFCPLLNDINPAALIADSFYSLNIYGIGERYTYNLCELVLMAVVCILIGSFTMRRKTYASL